MVVLSAMYCTRAKDNARRRAATDEKKQEGRGSTHQAAGMGGGEGGEGRGSAHPAAAASRRRAQVSACAIRGAVTNGKQQPGGALIA